MTHRLSRRDLLRGGAALAGLAAGGVAVRADAAATPVPPNRQQPPSLPVAIARCASYAPQALASQLRGAVALIGGIETNRGRTPIPGAQS